ncbi:MAG TPA: alpha-amylase/4-alpha-glucanotransferase domain-containing protein [bacterium]|nr:alpha-amylase/4-alpha-glucanotransferase domain-containing protein [bacterium]
MSTVRLLLSIHCHQPVGNFPEVFEKAYRECYEPFLATVIEHPGVLMTLHYSGPLLEWLEEHQPEYLDNIKTLVERGQVEIMGGGFYEPLLPTIPEEDAVGQIEMMKEYIERRFGYTPRGIWLAERVWDPDLPRILHRAGVHYTLLDDTHFLYGGLNHSQITGSYITERLGSTLSVFPISKKLRYSIPFKPVDEVIATLRQFSETNPGDGFTYGDDGEKFGLWPGTYDWVHKQRWLHNFFSALENNADWLKLDHFSTFLEEHKPRGRIYLPPASYEEMMEWALPVESSRRFKEILETVRRWEKSELYLPFLRGGQWENFLVKYPESNQIHKKMLYVSRKVSQAAATRGADPELQEARRHLWKGQCNCAYWHGLFGGLYLNYLRHALYANLLAAEQLLDRLEHGDGSWVEGEQLDFDRDGQEEILLRSPHLNLYVDPERGGSVWELDYKPAHFNLSNVLDRREEAYHTEVKNAVHGQQQDLWQRPTTIHEQAHVKEDGIESLLVYDCYPRRSFLDHFFSEETTLQDFSRSAYREWGDFLNQPYDVTGLTRSPAGETIRLDLQRQGTLLPLDQGIPLGITKSMEMSGGETRIRTFHRLSSGRPRPPRVRFGCEFNFTLLAGNDPKRYFRIPGVPAEGSQMESRGEVCNVRELFLVDEWAEFALALYFSRPCTLWRFPLETVSQAEDGFQKTYQGSVLLPWWLLNLEEESHWDLEIRIEIKTIKEWQNDRRFSRPF